jgi:succinate dehydrogenase/fumarate reductase flavoprotein subunit
VALCEKVRNLFPKEVDLVIVGSGAAGMAAAVTAVVEGQKVIVLEKTNKIGGTTSYSEAMIWVPCSEQARQAGIADSVENALDYLRSVIGNKLDIVQAEAYLKAAPQMLAFFERHTALRYTLATGSIDYYSDREGATSGARALCAGSFDGRKLGRRDFKLLRQPLRVAQLFGGMTIAATDLQHFYRVFRSVRSTLRVTQLIARYTFDRVTGWPRGTAIANGDGVIASLLFTLREKGGEIKTNAEVTQLSFDDRRVTGVTVLNNGIEQQIKARRGVVLASGGFSANGELRCKYKGIDQAKDNHVILVAEGATGDGMRLAENVGGVISDALVQPMAWAPTSWVPHLGSAFPHFVERAKPGVIAVDSKGRRFTNEAAVYHDFVPAMIDNANGSDRVEAWLIADHVAQRRYGLGAAPPAPGFLGPSIRSGYLKVAPSLRELAEKIGVDGVTLEESVGRFNTDAKQGLDTQFARGQSEQNRAYGDPDHGPNPCLGALQTAPFYAVNIQPGDLGSLVGLSIDARSRVLDKDKRPITGLYAAGLDAASMFGGHYPAAGVTVGSALTFGWIAARDALGLAG